MLSHCCFDLLCSHRVVATERRCLLPVSLLKDWENLHNIKVAREWERSGHGYEICLELKDTAMEKTCYESQHWPRMKLRSCSGRMRGGLLASRNSKNQRPVTREDAFGNVVRHAWSMPGRYELMRSSCFSVSSNLVTSGKCLSEYECVRLGWKTSSLWCWLEKEELFSCIKCWNHFERDASNMWGVGLGKVRVDMVKKSARKLMESYPDKFTTDFEEN